MNQCKNTGLITPVRKDLILGLAGGALSLIMLQVLVTLASWIG